MADLGFWRSVRPLAVGLAVGLATVALTGSTATATGDGSPGTDPAAAPQKVRVMPPVSEQAPCSCESQVGASLAGQPAALEPGGQATIKLTAWGKGPSQVGASVFAHQVPAGWQVAPASRSYTVDGTKSASAKLSYQVTAPATAKPGTYKLVFRTVPFAGTDSPQLTVSLTVR